MSVSNFNQKISSHSRETYSFQDELQFLQEDERMKVLCKLELRSYLQEVFHFEQAECSPFDLFLLHPKKVLFQFFDDILGDELHLPKGSIALKVFLKLCSQNIKTEYLRAALASQFLDDLDTCRLERLPVAHINNMKTIISFSEKFKSSLKPILWLLGVEMMSEMPPKYIKEQTADHLAFFLKSIFPIYFDRLAQTFQQVDEEGVSVDEVYSKPVKVGRWFLVWRNHFLKENENYPSTYYEQDFETIIQFVPLHLWWNHGVPYKEGKKAYSYLSDGFVHLALGGSIRNAPDYRPYTRRMAKEFVNLPIDFNPMGMDMYIYFYTKSLVGESELNYLLQDHIQHYHYTAKLQLELDRWNPVVQKLNCKAFYDLEEDDKRSLLGYLSHGLRDVKNFSVRKRSIAELMRATRDYEQRIQERALARANKQRRRDPPKNFWPPHKSIKPFEYVWKNKKFKIVELLTEGELSKEGAAMRHCVGTYGHACKTGEASIWSLRLWKDARWFSLVTIEIRRKRITQASGRFNSRPEMDQAELIRKWAMRENIIL